MVKINKKDTETASNTQKQDGGRKQLNEDFKEGNNSGAISVTNTFQRPGRDSSGNKKGDDEK